MTMTTDAPILLRIDGGIAVVTLNRPEKLNAFAGDMRERLLSALDTVAATAGVRVLVLTGAGRAFCAGGDVGFMHALIERGEPYEGLAPLVDAGADIVTRLASFPIPVLAAVNGVAAGAGANLMLACDVRLASDDARFGETFVRIGLHTDWGGSWALPRAVGVARALDLCWSGDLIDAPEMLRLGLVQRVWPAESFAREWRAYAERLAAAPATSVRQAKANLGAGPSRTLAEALAAESRAQRACWDAGDPAEGVRAFVERRAPDFTAGVVLTTDAAPSAAARRFE
jgi:2-(1,2-epoxy-1,2-dihydrophenyl)acetyl-CoA isomerase